MILVNDRTERDQLSDFFDLEVHAFVSHFIYVQLESALKVIFAHRLESKKKLIFKPEYH